MAKFNLDDYDLVEDRLRRFYADHEDGRVLTQLMSDVNNISVCVFRVDLYIGDILKSQGWATETAGDGYVNKTSHLENCETSAIGRALANAGYQGSKRPSREEMKKVERGTVEEKKFSDEPGVQPVLDNIKKAIEALTSESMQTTFHDDAGRLYHGRDLDGMKKLLKRIEAVGNTPLSMADQIKQESKERAKKAAEEKEKEPVQPDIF